MSNFEILAEIAVGLAGFGTIAIVLARDPGRWNAGDYFRTFGLFLSSLGALFLALLPIGLATTSLEDGVIWRASSAVLLVFLGVFGFSITRLRRRYLDRTLWMGPVMISTTAVTSLANFAAQILNIGGFWFEPNPTCMFFGIVWLLMFACIFLVRIVFVPPERSRSGEPTIEQVDRE